MIPYGFPAPWLMDALGTVAKIWWRRWTDEDPYPNPAGLTPSEYAVVLAQWYRDNAAALDTQP